MLPTSHSGLTWAFNLVIIVGLFFLFLLLS